MSDHCMRLNSVLTRFRQHNLQASKCSFGADKMVYLGHTNPNMNTLVNTLVRVFIQIQQNEVIKDLPSPQMWKVYTPF